MQKDPFFQLVAKTTAGLEEVLADEIREIGGQKVEIMHRAVAFEADKALMYKANYMLRTALRILKPLTTFKARDEKHFYDQVYKTQWHEFLKPEQTFAIDAVVSGTVFTHSHFMSLKTKDAIVDQFRERFGSRPSVDVNDPDLRINLHISNEQCIISLDSSGSSLHKRGYRSVVDKAPMNEVLAAGLIKLSGWQADCNFVDCMCGSGTLPIEAAMVGMQIPAGYFRKDYGFMKWGDFDAAVWEQVVNEANSHIREYDFQIIGADRSNKAIEIARENVRKAHLHKDIKLIKMPMEQFRPPEGKGVLIINPPYGERLEEADLIGLYGTIGDSLKQQFKGYKAWVISSDLPVLKRIGLKPSKKIKVFNGPLECRFVCFDIFDGSLKERKIEERQTR